MRIISSVSINMTAHILMACWLFTSCAAPAQRLTTGDMSITRPGATAVVVVHSRSGNTAALGLRISEAMGSDYIRLETPPGAGDTYLSYTDRNDKVDINPRSADLARYRLVFLGSPIWFWHPTAFIYTFINNNDLSGKKVVLFYTNQGGLAKDAIDEWKAIVQKRGGTVIDVIGINRNEFENDAALQSEIKTQVEKHKRVWINKSD